MKMTVPQLCTRNAQELNVQSVSKPIQNAKTFSKYKDFIISWLKTLIWIKFWDSPIWILSQLRFVQHGQNDVVSDSHEVWLQSFPSELKAILLGSVQKQIGNLEINGPASHQCLHCIFNAMYAVSRWLLACFWTLTQKSIKKEEINTLTLQNCQIIALLTE